MKKYWRIFLIIATIPASPLDGRTIRVKKGATGAADGESWPDAFPELQDALQSAQPGDELWVASGIYKPASQGDLNSAFELKADVAIYGGFVGTETERNLRNPDPETNGTVLSGDLLNNDSDEFSSRDDNSRNIVIGRDLQQAATLDGFTITNGGTVDSSKSSFGSGINTLNSPVILKNLRLLDNHGRIAGGCYFTTSTVTLENCHFESNKGGERGGGIYVFRSQMTATQCQFVENEASNGGALHIQETDFIGSNLSFIKNQGRNGGAIYSQDANAELWNSVLAENGNIEDPGSFVGRGGAIYSDTCLLQVTNCAFIGNLVKQAGGAIHASSDEAINPPEKVVTVVNSTFFGNGVIATGPFPPRSTVFFCNTPSSILLQNSIVAPAPGQREQFVFDDELPFGRYSLHPESCCNLIEGGLSGYQDILNASPRFIDPEGPDGIPATADDNLSLQDDSLALGNALINLLPNDRADLDGDSDTGEATPIDLAGQKRISGVGLDLGAFERQGLSFTANNISLPQIAEGEVTIPDWLSGFSGNEDLSVAITRVNSPDALPFLMEPALSETGSLTFTPMTNASGIAIYQISISDNSGNLPTPPLQIFSISIGQRILRVDQAASGLADGTTWEDAFAYLENALAIAEPGDQIWVAQGRYTPALALGRSFHIPPSVSLFGGFQGSEENLAERPDDPQTHATVLDGDILGDDEEFEHRSDNSTHVIILNDVDSDTMIDRFTIRGGEATDPDGESKGGAIWCQGDPILRDLTILENRAIYGGGFFSAQGEPQFQGCHFVQNVAIEEGGAISFETSFGNEESGMTVIESCRFMQNSATTSGGAVRGESRLLFLKSCRFEENSSRSGGALRLTHESCDLLDCDFIGNSAQAGAAISTYGFSGRIQSNRFIGNSATYDGGSCYFLSESTPWFINCIFTGNEAGDEGGAIKMDDSSLRLTHCTLAHNAAASGGGLMLDAKKIHTLQNSIIWGNHSFNFPSEVIWFHDNHTYQDDIPDHLITLSPESGGLLVRGGLRNRDDVFKDRPRFVNASGSDEMTGTEDDNVRIGQFSPARGAGLIEALPGDLFDIDDDGAVDDPLPFDLDGGERLVGQRPDLGAFEADGLSFYFPDVRLAEVPERPVVTPSWTLIDSTESFAFATMITARSGTLDFNSPVTISPSGTLRFEVSPGTSGWASFMVSTQVDGGISPVGSFTIFVSPVVHFVKENQENPGNGRSWDQSFAGLSEALTHAHEGDEIRLSKGTYYAAGAPERTATFRIKQGVQIRGGFDGTESGNSPTDPGARSTLSGLFKVEDGRVQRAAVVVTAEQVDENTLLESLVIRGGGGSLIGRTVRGAGLVCELASPTLRKLAIIDNLAVNNGAGIYLSRSDSTIDRCFIGNNLSSRNGGGIYLGSFTNVRVINSVISGNRAFEGGGGIAALTFNSNFTLINSTIANNITTRGSGGIEVRTTQATIRNSIVFNNSRNGDISEITNGSLQQENLSNNIVRGGHRDFGPERALDASPLFVNALGPDGIAGTLDDDFRLLQSSPAIDAGAAEFLPIDTEMDFLNQPRTAGIQVDMGAIEGSIPATFALLHPGLDPNGDANGNGVSNHAEYAAGFDPTRNTPSDLGLHAAPGRLAYQIRGNAADVTARIQKSANLDNWTDLIEGDDFTIEDPVASQGGVNFHTLQFTQPSPQALFFRQVFEPLP